VKRLAIAVVAFAAIGAGLLCLAGELGAVGLVIVAAVELLVILRIARASTRA
jgi:hypothetical protein